MITCKNCNNNFNGKFCNECGQEDFAPPFNVKKFFKEDIKNEIIGFDNGFVFTIKKFLFQPGETIYNYVKGVRVGFVAPFAFIVISLAFSELINKYTAVQQFYPPTKEDGNVITKILNLLQNDPKWLMMIQIPFFSVVTANVFRKYRLPFGDHFLFNIYALSMFNIIGAFCLFPLFLSKSQQTFGTMFLISLAMNFGFYILITHQFFKKQNHFMSNTLMRSVLASMAGFTGIAVIFILLAVLENIF